MNGPFSCLERTPFILCLEHLPFVVSLSNHERPVLMPGAQAVGPLTPPAKQAHDAEF